MDGWMIVFFIFLKKQLLAVCLDDRFRVQNCDYGFLLKEFQV